MAVSKKRKLPEMQETEDMQEQNIMDVEYSDVMRKSYIDYSMSVIVTRAIPDIRDGLKPVHRRILYDMSDLGICHDKPYRKCARIVGDTMGKYHPHGDSSIYDALVVMAQDFKKEQRLVDGHGNYGSIEGDGAAAMRYTEARLEKFSEKVFFEYMHDGTVEYVPNYDDTEKEPDILPCRIPNFLINGSEGIAVGMATSTPPHNLAEAIDTTVYLIDHPNATVPELLDILHGPDFPTGGIVSNKSELLHIYETGTGKVKIRGRIDFEAGNGTEKDRLVVSEIPYTMTGEGISKFLQSVAELVESKVLMDIVDIANQTSKDGVRIVFELKKNADVEYIKNVLYKKTKLEDTFGVNMLFISDGRPEVYGLKEALEKFLDFRYEVERKRYETLLSRIKDKIEVTEGLLRAIDIMDLIIEILRRSKTVAQAKKCLTEGVTDGISFKTKTDQKNASKLDFTEAQAAAILGMRLSRLVGLEIEDLRKDYEKSKKLQEKYEKILSGSREIQKEVQKDMLLLKEEFGVPRKTEIADMATVEIEEREETEYPIAVLVDKFHYIHTVDMTQYEKNKESVLQECRYCIKTTNRSKIVVFCDTGKAHIIKVQDIPYGKLKDKGSPIDNVCNYNSKDENVVGIADINDGMYIFISSDGYIKQTDMVEFDVTRKTVDATKLKDDATVVAVIPAINGGMVVLETEDGFYIRFRQDEIPVQKKNAVGAIGMKLSQGDKVKHMYSVGGISDQIEICGTVSEAARIKAMHRGAKGTKIRI